MIRVTLVAAGMSETHSAQASIMRLEKPTTPRPTSAGYPGQVARSNSPVANQAPAPRQQPASASYPGQAARSNNPAANQTPAPRQQPRYAGNSPLERPVPETIAEPPVQPAKYTDKTARPLGRPQRSLDDLRGLRSMGRRQETQRSNSQADEEAEIEMPPFLRRFD